MKRITLLLALFSIAFAIKAQNRLTPELLWELDRVGSPMASPDGKYIAFTITDYNWKKNSGKTDIYLMSTKGGEAKKLTADIATSCWNLEWRPDGKFIGFINSTMGAPQVFEMNIENPEEIRQVTNYEGGVTGFHYSNSMNRIVFSANVKLDQNTVDRYPDLPQASGRVYDDLMYRHWDQWHDYSYSHIFVQNYDINNPMGEYEDIMKGEKYDAPLSPFGGSEEYTISPNGLKIAYTCKKLSGKEYAESTNSDIYVYDFDSKMTENVSMDNFGYDKTPVFSPDGEKLIWSSMWTPGYESDKNTITLKENLADPIITDLLKGKDISADHLTWSEDGEEIFFTSGVNATFHLFKLNVGSKKVEQITEGECNFSGYTIAGKSAFAQRSTMQEPNTIFEINLKNGSYERFLNWNDDILSKLDKSTVRKHWIKTSTGEKMLTWMILPPNFDSTKSYPTLLYCQGGPQAAISQYYSFRWNFELMAANDYIIIAPNRHGVPTFGQKYNHQISGDWGGQAMKDYVKATTWASKFSYVDEKRLGCVGASYGGYSVYWLAGHNKKRFKCFIAHCGLYNLDSWYGSTEEMFFANYDLKGAPWDNNVKGSYQAFNPANFIKNWDSPILVIHGEKDFRVPVGEGIQAFNSAQLLDIESRFLYFPDEGHWVLQPQNGILWHREFFRWLDDHLK
ncbi:MAG: S9 family peptidase [Bacteroidia bacterium]